MATGTKEYQPLVGRTIYALDGGGKVLIDKFGVSLLSKKGIETYSESWESVFNWLISKAETPG